jgi:hypothetical protein
MNRSFLAMVSFITLGMAAPAPAQNRDAALAALMKLPAAERHARLVEGAKKESGLVWYSSTTAEDALALSKKFNEQHPSIQIQHLRSSSEKLLERILAESRANAFKADIVTLPELELSIMIKRKLLYDMKAWKILSTRRKAKIRTTIGPDCTLQLGCRRTIPRWFPKTPRRNRTKIYSIPNGRAGSPWTPSRTIGSWFRCAIWSGATAKKRRWIS